MTYDESIASIRAHAERTSRWAAEEAERVKWLYAKYSTGDPDVDPRDVAVIVRSHQELLLRVSGGESFRCEMLVESLEALRGEAGPEKDPDGLG